MKLADLTSAINRFLFEPVSPTPIALFRICIGLIVLQDVFVHLLADFKVYYGDYAVVPIQSMVTKYWAKECYFDLMLLLPNDENWRLTFLFLLGLAALFMTLGLFSRVSMITVFLCLLSIDSHFELNQNDGDVYLRLACMILSMSNAGDAFSFDNLLRACREDWRITGFRPRLSSPWAQRWMQMQTALCYWHTFVAKMSGRRWIDGMAVYYTTRYDDIIRFPVPYFFDSILTVKLLTWGTLVTEFSLWALIWFRELRYWVILAGLFLHLGIEWAMNLPMFEWLFIASFLNFVYPEDLSKTMDKLKAKVYERYGPPRLFAYDGNSIYSVRAAGILHRLDMFGFLKLVDWRQPESPLANFTPSTQTLYLEESGNWISGPQAFSYLTRRLPWFMPVSPLFTVPALAGIGSFLYHLVEANQKLLLGGSCQTSNASEEAVPKC
jgi:hypothetical protein